MNEHETARPKDYDAGHLQTWLPDPVRYWCQHLRAIADLMEAGEPMNFFQTHRGAGDAEVKHFTIAVNRWHLAHAFLDVARRVQAGEPDYAIKTTPQPPSRPPQRKRH